MKNNKNWFWRNFTWRKFWLIACYMFVMTLAVACVWNYIAGDPVSPLVTISALLHRLFSAILVGFTLSGLLNTKTLNGQ